MSIVVCTGKVYRRRKNNHIEIISKTNACGIYGVEYLMKQFFPIIQEVRVCSLVVYSKQAIIKVNVSLNFNKKCNKAWIVKLFPTLLTAKVEMTPRITEKRERIKSKSRN